MVKRKRYASEVLVRPATSLEPLPNFASLYKLLAEVVYPQSPVQFETAGLVFDVDFALPNKQASFTFQRRFGVPREENLYYSHGPFSSEQHERVLNELEKLLAA
jgi:hypothetical protein